MSKIAFVSHCLLNNLSKVEAFPNKNKLLIKHLLEKDVELVQMPCPEFTMLGGSRFGQVVEQYDNPFFRKHCRQLIEPFIQQIEEYRRVGHEIFGILAIKGSPSCGFLHTASAPSWKGEDRASLPEAVLKEGPGVFMDELEKALGGLVEIYEVDEENIENTIRTLQV